MCRTVIRDRLTSDRQISQLPFPQPVKSFLRNNDKYDDEKDIFDMILG
jgi:hypothetical protein